MLVEMPSILPLGKLATGLDTSARNKHTLVSVV
jgi:hypothetical protein